jgi:hypothetical protein
MKVILRVEPKNRTQPEETTPIIPQSNPDCLLSQDQQLYISTGTTYLNSQPPLAGRLDDASTPNPSRNSPSTSDRTTASLAPPINGTCDTPTTERGVITTALGLACLSSSSTALIADNLVPRSSDGKILLCSEYERVL